MPIELISRANFSFLYFNVAEFGAKLNRGCFSSTAFAENSIIPSSSLILRSFDPH